MKAKLFVSLMITLTMFGSVVLYARPALACSDSLLGLPAWYRGLQDSHCDIKAPDKNSNTGLSTFIWTIGLNVLQDLLMAVGYISVFFVIRGGFKYLTTTGSSEGIAASKKIIENALIGLVISMMAAGIVNAVVGAIQ